MFLQILHYLLGLIYLVLKFYHLPCLRQFHFRIFFAKTQVTICKRIYYDFMHYFFVLLHNSLSNYLFL